MNVQAKAAIITPSYAGDFERCRLLCETMDRFVSGYERHYLLVAGHDVARFKALEGAKRVVIDERDLLPGWLYGMRDPASLFRRHIWLSLRAPPLRGWHVQQLRRIAIAQEVDAPALVYCDSDVMFLKPFDCAHFWRGDALRLYRKDHGLGLMDEGTDHNVWSMNAGKALGLPSGQISDHDYISTLISWRRDTVLSMVRHIETQHGRHWIETVAADRRFSECLLYGRYVDEVLKGEGHFHDARQLCRVYWSGPELNAQGVHDFASGMEAYQVAIGIQSFTGTNLAPLQALLD